MHVLDMMDMMSGGGPGGMSSNVVEALVPNSMTQEQVYRLFDIVPGLENCSINPMSGTELDLK